MGCTQRYFGDVEPFGSSTLRKAPVDEARKTARRQNRGRKTRRIELDDCPGPEDIDEYADALEEQYPGYGRRMVHLCFATGLRINEALALRWDSIDLVTLDVAVDWQLDRYGNWPDLVLPKGGKRRTAQLWAYYFDVAVTWQRHSAGDWTTYAADISRRQPTHSESWDI